MGANLEILLIKRGLEPEAGKWSLMGGFVQNGENLVKATARVLKKLTGLENVYLEELHSFSEPGRDPGGKDHLTSLFCTDRYS